MVDDGRPPEEFELPIAGGFVTSGPVGIGEWAPDDSAVETPLEIAAGTEADPAVALRRTLGMFATGVTIVTTRAEDQVHGMTANAFMSVSLDPPLIVISVDRRARMHGLLHEGRRFGVSVLASDQHDLSDHFAGRDDGIAEARFEVIHQSPLVEGALAHLVARVVRSYWGGDHSLFLGQVEYARYGAGAPLLFHGGWYEQLLAKVPLFSSLSAPLLEPILRTGERRSYAAGDVIVREGDPGQDLFVILTGTVRVERGGRVLQVLSEGEFFGEVAVLDGRPRSADVIAGAAVDCLLVSREVLRTTLASEPRAAWAMLEILAGRLRED
jgi:flavin reductase (DIM6/NTAB) family NADH-FMN oxidoreductase RutF